jgi:hypothetical protein
MKKTAQSVMITRVHDYQIFQQGGGRIARLEGNIPKGRVGLVDDKGIRSFLCLKHFFSDSAPAVVYLLIDIQV